jgi:predicted Zn-dependent peptidase
MGVCYSVGTDTEYYVDTGLFKMVSGVDTDRLTESIQAMVNVLKSVTSEQIPDEEFKKAKEHRIGNFLLNHETTDQIARHLGELSVLEQKIESPRDYAKRLRDVTKDDVIRETKSLLGKNLQAAVIGPQCDTEEVEDILQIQK